MTLWVLALLKGASLIFFNDKNIIDLNWHDNSSDLRSRVSNYVKVYLRSDIISDVMFTLYLLKCASLFFTW